LANAARRFKVGGDRVRYDVFPPVVNSRFTCISDDDDEEAEEEEPKESTDAGVPAVDADAMEATPANSDGEAVKVEPDQPAPAKKKVRERTPSYELHMYSAEELSKFKKREMIADSELLDGTLIRP
jgi:structural maintenance of chromosome 4